MDVTTLSLFDNYIHDLLSEREKADFEQRLNIEPDLKIEFEKYSILVDGIKSYERERLKNEIKAAALQTDGRALHLDNNTRVLTRRRLYAIAATLIILLLPGYYVYQKATFSNRMYHEYYVQDPGLPIVMGEAENTTFNNAMIEYKDAKYTNALALFNQLLSKDIYNDSLNFYAGICCMETDNAEKSVELFSKINEMPSSRFYIPANYYIGLSYVKMKNFEAAKGPLAKVSESSYYLNVKAKELLHELD